MIRLDIHENIGGRLAFRTKLLPVDISHFRLYVAPAASGPFTFLRTFPNADSDEARGQALVRTTRSESGLDSDEYGFFVVTSVTKTGIESPIVESSVASIAPELGSDYDSHEDSPESYAQITGYDQVSGRWLPLRADPDGLLKTSTASVLPVGAATEAKQDDIISALTTGAVPVSDLFTNWQSISVSVTSTSPFDLLSAAALVSPPLTNLKNITVQNLTGAPIYLGGTSGSTVFRVSNLGTVQFPTAGLNPSIYAESESGTGEIVVLEFN